MDCRALENLFQEPEADSSLIFSLIREPFLKLQKHTQDESWALVVVLGIQVVHMIGKDSTAELYVQTGPRGFGRVLGSGSSGQARLQPQGLVVPDLSAPPSPSPESPGLPQKCHVVLDIDRVAENVAF